MCLFTTTDIDLQLKARSSRGRRSRTVLDVVEHDELLPAQLLHQRQHDVVESDRRPGSQRVALPPRARVELAGGAGGALAVPLDVEVGDVHGVRQRLQSAGRRAARRRHQRQDALVHELAGWGGERERRVRRGEDGTEARSRKTNGDKLWFLLLN